MKTNNTLPRWGQMTAGGVLLAIAITAGAVSLTLNVQHGLDSGGLITAVSFGLADAARIALAIICGWIGWNWQTRLTLTVCAVSSVLCVSSYLLDTSGRELLAREGQATEYAGAQADLARIRAELAAITETGDASALTAAAGLATSRAEAEAANGGCRKSCLAAQADAAALTERAGKAKRRDELQKRLTDAKTEARASGGPAEVSGLASLAATVWHVAPERAARFINAGKAALGILLLEVLVYLAIPGAGLLAHGWTGGRTKTGQGRGGRGPGRSKPVDQAGPSADVIPLRDRQIIAMTRKGDDQRTIAAALGISKSTVQRRQAALGISKARQTATEGQGAALAV